MNAVGKLFERKAIWALVGGVVLGLVLGVLYAWVVNPVAWEDALPSHLRPDLRADYLRMVIDSYSVNKNVDQALERYEVLGEYGQAALQEVGEKPEDLSPTAIQNLRAMLVISMQPGLPPSPLGTAASAAGPAAPSSSLTRFLFPICAGTFFLGLVLFVVVLMRGRVRGLPSIGGGKAPAPKTKDRSVDLRRAMGPVEPLATFHTVYNLGDDLYDDSFSIESSSGDFLGECGVGLGDIMGSGEPSKVSAFEVWLFDKNDIQTVTKVLMSRYAYNDEATRNRLAAKGESVLAESGTIIRLETASLVVEARIVDMSFGQGPLPAQSYFERMTIELKAWQQLGA